MNLIKPKKLQKGDTIGIIAVSGNLKDEKNLIKACDYFQKKGFNVVLAKNIYDKKRYLAGSDEIRLNELHGFFSDEKIDAIIALRGGYGAIRLINKIDYDLIRNNPKIFAGYSDISALSAMFLKKSGLITYSSPMCAGDFGIENIDEFTASNFFKILMSDETIICEPFERKVYKEGTAKGITFGGNLATIVSLCGVDFIPDKDFIFFIEDLNEPVYKIDKMMTQLINISDFRKRIKGIVIGEFLGIDNKEWFYDIFKEIGEELTIPVIGNFRISHGKRKMTIPYGEMSEIRDNKFIICNKKA